MFLATNIFPRTPCSVKASPTVQCVVSVSAETDPTLEIQTTADTDHGGNNRRWNR